MKNTRQLVVVGHRGAKGLALENTAASMEAALAYGVDQVEVDLRMSKDGVVVLLHDRHPVARNGDLIHAHDYTYKELLGYFPDLLTFDELLPLINHRCRIMLEFKEFEAVEPSLVILRKYLTNGWKPSEFMFASFHLNVLQALKQQQLGIDLVVLESWSSVRAVARARLLNAEYLSMDQRFLWWGYIWLVSRRYKLFCYPHHKLLHIDHVKPKRWAKYGLFGVITDYPNFFLAKRPSGIVEGHESDIPSQPTAE